MNKYQKIAFGAFGLLTLALIIGATYDLNGLKVAVIVTLVVALLTLKTTWKLLLSGTQFLGFVVGGLGHLVGIVGDEVYDWSLDRKVRLVKSSEVPAWDSPELNHVGLQDAEPSDELDVPSFMDETLEHQNT
jgi:hypothetical protein